MKKKIILLFFIVSAFINISVANATNWQYVKTNIYNWYDIYVDIDSIKKLSYNDHYEYYYWVKKKYYDAGRKWKVEQNGAIHYKLNYSLIHNHSSCYTGSQNCASIRIIHYDFNDKVYFDKRYPDTAFLTWLNPQQEGFHILEFVVHHAR